MWHLEGSGRARATTEASENDSSLSPSTLSLSNELGPRCFSFPLARSLSAAQRAVKLCNFVQIAAKMKHPRSKTKPRGEKRSSKLQVSFLEQMADLNTIGSILGREKSSPPVKPQAAITLPPAPPPTTHTHTQQTSLPPSLSTYANTQDNTCLCNMRVIRAQILTHSRTSRRVRSAPARLA